MLVCIRGCMIILLALGGILIVGSAKWSPLGGFFGSAAMLVPLSLCWKSVRGTALRSALIWSWLAWLSALIAQGTAWTESVESGRPWSGHWTYLATLAVLASLLTVFNARRPGGGAWAGLMAVLVLVSLIPWLEATGLSRTASPWDRLRLEAPWSWFFSLLALAAASNYLPTRHGVAALIALAGFAVVGWGMTTWDRSEETRGKAWMLGLWLFSTAGVIAFAGSYRATDSTDELDRVWFWFRDRWGVVWGLRVMERFNETARASHWPIRLSWHGLVRPPQPHSTPTAESLPETALSTLVVLLRRFADPERVLKGALSRECD